MVTMRSIETDGLVGVLCSPTEPAPGVLLLGGSEGGLHERDARVLAGHGFTVLALAYFGAPGPPPGLVDIPLEYFFHGLDVLGSHATGDRLGVTGGSRGGEAALLVAAHDARIAATVSVVGSGIVTEGIDFRRGRLVDVLTGGPTNSWTLGGEPIPYLPYSVADELRADIDAGRPVRLAQAFAAVPSDPAELSRVSIPIEQSTGRVLLVSAADDASWPSAAYSEVAAARLRAHGRPVEHRVLGAGHSIAGPPGAPFTATISPGPGVTFELGGTPATNTAAREQAWLATVAFFEEHLRT